MKHLDLDTLKTCLTEMFGECPEVESIDGLIVAFGEAADEDEETPTYDEIRKACEELVDEDILQAAGREGFEATIDFMVERGHEVV